MTIDKKHSCMNIKVSIIVPTLNAEKYLQQCLDSVIIQNLKEIEIICIDNNSTDNTVSILNKYASQDNRIKVVAKNKNTGYGSSINLGIKEASGKYVGIVEADDFIDKKMFSTLYDLAEKTKAEIVKSNFYRYDAFSNRDKKHNLFLPNEVNKIVNPTDNQHILSRNACIWSALYRRDFLIDSKINLIDSPNHSFQDASFNFKLFATAQKVYFTPDAFYHYRVGHAEQSVKSRKYLTSIIDEYNEIKCFLNNKNIFKKFRAVFTESKFYGYKWNIERLPLLSALHFSKLAQKDFISDRNNNRLDILCMNNYCQKDIKFLMTNPLIYTLKTKLAKFRERF